MINLNISRSTILNLLLILIMGAQFIPQTRSTIPTQGLDECTPPHVYTLRTVIYGIPFDMLRVEDRFSSSHIIRSTFTPVLLGVVANMGLWGFLLNAGPILDYMQSRRELSPTPATEEREPRPKPRFKSPLSKLGIKKKERDKRKTIDPWKE